MITFLEAPPQVRVPDVRGMTARDAQHTLEGAGLIPLLVSLQDPRTGASCATMVRQQVPSGDRFLVRGEAVAVYLE